eukprot:4417719-Karenia_brevis.AAC.1
MERIAIGTLPQRFGKSRVRIIPAHTRYGSVPCRMIFQYKTKLFELVYPGCSSLVKNSAEFGLH